MVGSGYQRGGQDQLWRADYASLKKLETMIYLVKSHRMVLTIGMKLLGLCFRKIFLAGIQRMMNQKGM